MSTQAASANEPDDGPSLAGVRILLPAREAAALAEALRATGAEVTEVALTRIMPQASAELDTRLTDLAAGVYDWVAFTSATTLRCLGTIAVGRAKVAAVGAATAEAARRTGLPVALVPVSGHGGAALAEAWPAGIGRVLIPGARESSPVLAARLRSRGWTVDEVAVYETTPVEDVPPQVRADWAAEVYDVLVVTAGSVARAARTLLGPGGPEVVAIGAPSAEAATAAGFHVAAVAATADAAGLMRGLRDYRKEDR